MTIKFCNNCRKAAYRIVEILPAAVLDREMILEMSDNEIEDIAHAESQIRVLSAPDWRPVLTCSSSSSKISFGCPWCGKGKIKLLN